MASSAYQAIKDSVRQLYLDDPRPWLVGYSGGKDSAMVASLVFDAVPPDQRKKPVAILCTDTHQENPKREIRNPKPGCHSELVEESQLSHLDGADKRLNSQTPRGQGGNSNPWGNDNRAPYKPSPTRRRCRVRQLYASASNGECPIQIDTSTPRCGHSRFGCWTCTVVERDKASEGLLAAGDERMEKLIEFRETLLEYQDPANGKRDRNRKDVRFVLASQFGRS